MRPVCVKCGLEYHCAKAGVYLVHFIDNKESHGIDFIMAGDIYQCPDCKVEIVTAFGKRILASDPEFKKIVDNPVKWVLDQRAKGFLCEVKYPFG